MTMSPLSDRTTPARLQLLQRSLLHFRFRGAERLLLAARPLLRPPSELGGAYRTTRVRMRSMNDLQYLNFLHLAGFELVKLMEWLLPERGTFVDVGANYGYVTCHAARIVGPGGAVVAVEPNPNIVSRLIENVRDND